MPSQRPARRGPGLIESAVWCAGLVTTQVLGAVAVAATILASSVGIPTTLAQVESAALMLWEPEYLEILVGCGAVIPVLIGVPAVVLRIGAQWRQQLMLSPPRTELMLLALGATIPMTIVCAACRSAAQQFAESLGLATELSAVPNVVQVVNSFEGWPFALLVSVVALGPAVIEEFVFRGLIGRGLTARYGLVAGVLMTSLLFAGMHLSPVYAAGVLPLGIFLHLVYLTTGSLKAAIGLHFANNLLAAAAVRFHLLDDLQVDTPLVFIAFGAVLAISGLLCQHGVETAISHRFRPQSQAVAGTAVGGFTILFVAAAL